MPSSANTVRRGCGLLFLALAFGMLVAGRTAFVEKLKGAEFLIYWSVCFFFTFAAIVTALLDIRATRLSAQREQQELLDKTLNDIDRHSGSKGRDETRKDT